MEKIITIVGFLGAGKTTLLKYLLDEYIKIGWSPFIILNDYENANLDIQQFFDSTDPSSVKALSGSCICCNGIMELRDLVNRIPARKNGITLIEANGTSDSCSLMGFLGVGIKDQFHPPIQISVVDAKNWQQRGEHNELEANQVQVSSMLVLTHIDSITAERKDHVVKDLRRLNPSGTIVTMDEVKVHVLPQLLPSDNRPGKMDHLKAHWASCSADLPVLPSIKSIEFICNELPKEILRVKGCTKIGDEDNYTYFERTPDGQIYIRPYNGEPVTGAKLLTVGLGSELSLLQSVIERSIVV